MKPVLDNRYSYIAVVPVLNADFNLCTGILYVLDVYKHLQY